LIAEALEVVEGLGFFVLPDEGVESGVGGFGDVVGVGFDFAGAVRVFLFLVGVVAVKALPVVGIGRDMDPASEGDFVLFLDRKSVV
jgi:hypothetical protein